MIEQEYQIIILNYIDIILFYDTIKLTELTKTDSVSQNLRKQKIKADRFCERQGFREILRGRILCVCNRAEFAV